MSSNTDENIPLSSTALPSTNGRYTAHMENTTEHSRKHKLTQLAQSLAQTAGREDISPEDIAEALNDGFGYRARGILHHLQQRPPLSHGEALEKLREAAQALKPAGEVDGAQIAEVIQQQLGGRFAAVKGALEAKLTNAEPVHAPRLRIDSKPRLMGGWGGDGPGR